MKRCVIGVLLALVLSVNGVFGASSPPGVLPEEGEKVEVVPPDEVRNQDFYVPTKNGPDRANLKEAKIIDKLEQKSDKELLTAYLLGDFASGQILEEYNIDVPIGLASVSKLVSSYVVLDKLQEGIIHKEDVVTIDHEVASLPGSTYKLKEGDQKTVEELLKATLVISGNDAVTALGKYIAGSTEGFVAMMNEKCKSLGLTHAHMINPHGLTDYVADDYNKMTARELFQLTIHLLRDHPEILEITKIPKIEEPSRNFLAYNTNPILGIVPQIDGLKTGYTNAAGRCLVATGKKSGIPGFTEDIRLIGIAMGAKGDLPRFVAVRRMMTNAFTTYNLHQVARKDGAVGTLHVEHGVPKEVPVFPSEDHSILWASDKKLDHKVTYHDVEPPIGAGAVVGSVTYTLNGEKVWATNVVTREEIKEENIIFRLQRLLYSIFEEIRSA